MESFGTGARGGIRKEEGVIRDFFLKRQNSFFSSGLMLKMLHLVVERKIFYTFALRTAAIPKFSFPII